MHPVQFGENAVHQNGVAAQLVRFFLRDAAAELSLGGELLDDGVILLFGVIQQLFVAAQHIQQGEGLETFKDVVHIAVGKGLEIFRTFRPEDLAILGEVILEHLRGLGGQLQIVAFQNRPAGHGFGALFNFHGRDGHVYTAPFS